MNVYKSIWCSLGDCNFKGCHHCFPVINCSFQHETCKEGTCKEIFREKILVTGCCGFIGSHLCETLLHSEKFIDIMGIDNLNDYYDVSVKEKNLKILMNYSNFSFKKEDIRDTNVITQWKPDIICHLASMAGVRYSIENPKIYFDINVTGFIHILEQAKKANVKKITYASSSSVYGKNKKLPFSEEDSLNNICSPYALSKFMMEKTAELYRNNYDMHIIGFRFFTVYGPRGRPDMAPYKFLSAIKNGEIITKYGTGDSSRDYTYVDDIVEGIISSFYREASNEVYNLGNSNPISLNAFIQLCEETVGKKAIIKEIENQMGDVPHTYANITRAQQDLDFNPKVKLKEGLNKTFEWIKIFDILNEVE